MDLDPALAPGIDGAPARAETLAAGPFERDAVHATLRSTPRPSDAALDAWIARRWQAALERAAREGRELFDGALLRFLSANARRDVQGRATLELEVGPGSYRDFAATNLDGGLRPADRGGECPWERFGNALGTSAIVATADGRLVLGRRSERVFGQPGHVHAFGGMLEAADAAGGRVDVFASIARELHEELGLDAGALRGLALLAVVREPELHQPELIFLATTSWTAGGIEGAWAGASSRDEHAALLVLPGERAAARAALLAQRKVSPIALACLDHLEDAPLP